MDYPSQPSALGPPTKAVQVAHWRLLSLPLGAGAAVLFGRHQTDIGYQLLGAIEPGEIADLGRQRCDADHLSTAHRLKIANEQR